jgi:hypothetical protein
VGAKTFHVLSHIQLALPWKRSRLLFDRPQQVWFSSSSWVTYLFLFTLPYSHKLLSPTRIFPISVMLSHDFGATSNPCVPQEMKVEWTLLTAPICKCRCWARNLCDVHPRSARFRAQMI